MGRAAFCGVISGRAQMTDSLSNFKPLGYVWEGHTFLFGEGEVSIERFNEVVGGDLGNGWSLSYEVADDDSP